MKQNKVDIIDKKQFIYRRDGIGSILVLLSFSLITCTALFYPGTNNYFTKTCVVALCAGLVLSCTSNKNIFITSDTNIANTP